MSREELAEWIEKEEEDNNPIPISPSTLLFTFTNILSAPSSDYCQQIHRLAAGWKKIHRWQMEEWDAGVEENVYELLPLFIQSLHTLLTLHPLPLSSSTPAHDYMRLLCASIQHICKQKHIAREAVLIVASELERILLHSSSPSVPNSPSSLSPPAYVHGMLLFLCLQAYARCVEQLTPARADTALLSLLPFLRSCLPPLLTSPSIPERLAGSELCQQIMHEAEQMTNTVGVKWYAAMDERRRPDDPALLSPDALLSASHFPQSLSLLYYLLDALYATHATFVNKHLNNLSSISHHPGMGSMFSIYSTLSSSQSPTIAQLVRLVTMRQQLQRQADEMEEEVEEEEEEEGEEEEEEVEKPPSRLALLRKQLSNLSPYNSHHVSLYAFLHTAMALGKLNGIAVAHAAPRVLALCVDIVPFLSLPLPSSHTLSLQLLVIDEALSLLPVSQLDYINDRCCAVEGTVLSQINITSQSYQSIPSLGSHLIRLLSIPSLRSSSSHRGALLQLLRKFYHTMSVDGRVEWLMKQADMAEHTMPLRSLLLTHAKEQLLHAWPGAARSNANTTGPQQMVAQRVISPALLAQLYVLLDSTKHDSILDILDLLLSVLCISKFSLQREKADKIQREQSSSRVGWNVGATRQSWLSLLQHCHGQCRTQLSALEEALSQEKADEAQVCIPAPNVDREGEEKKEGGLATPAVSVTILMRNQVEIAIAYVQDCIQLLQEY